MKTTIITIGNGGYHIAADCIEAGIFSDYKLIVCDSDADDLSRNSVSADCSFLLDRSVDKISLNNPILEPIVNEVTDGIYFFATLGGWVTRINILPLIMALDVPREFVGSFFPPIMNTLVRYLTSKSQSGSLNLTPNISRRNTGRQYPCIKMYSDTRR